MTQTPEQAVASIMAQPVSIEDRLAALVAAPKPFKTVVRYASGKAREIPALTEGAARNCADREAGKIGRALIDQMTGETVHVVSVSVERNG